MAIKPDYSVGSISLDAGGTTITGVDTFWASSTIQAGDELKVQNLSAIIATVDSNTQITLVEPWTGTALVAAPYRIRYQPDGSRYHGAVRDLIVELGNGNIEAFAALAGALDMIPIFTGTGALTLIAKTDLIEGIQVDAKVETLAARAAYDAETTGFAILVADVGDGRSAIYFKVTSTSGDWSDPAYLTGPNGVVQSQGPYNPATAYVLGQIVLDNGSSWIARVNTTGNAPPTLPTTSNTQWFLFAAAGNGFVFRDDYSGATAYLKDDVVVFNNSSWIAKQATTGNSPPALPTTSNTWWKAIAVRGSGDVSGPSSATAGNVPTLDATGKVLADSGIPASSISRGFIDRVLTTSGTWTKPAGLKKLEITLVGGGGSGTAGATTGANQASAGGGGAAAGVVQATYDVSDLPAASYAYVVGAGGAGGGGATGTAGTATTFKALTANGGAGGGTFMSPGANTAFAASTGGAAGSGTNSEAGTVIVSIYPGGGGTPGERGFGGAVGVARPGSGGCNIYTATNAVLPASSGTYAAIPGRFPGGGGSGGFNGGAGTTQNGGSGADGVIYIREWY